MYNCLSLAVVSLTTLILRALPFILFGNGEKTSPYILYLGEVLPAPIMMMLVVYCLKDVHVMVPGEMLPAAIAVALTAVLQWAKHNTLLSIIAGTLSYMVLIQMIF